MLVRPCAVPLALLLALTGCESGSTGAGDVLVVAHVEITPPGITLVAGNTQQLQATPKTSSGITVPNRQVTWSSDDQGIATVSSIGTVTAVASGSTRISALVDGVRASIAVGVSPRPVMTVTVAPDQVSLLVGQSSALVATPRDNAGQPLAGRPVSFASDNALIATVSTDGHVTAVAPGLTVVRATVEGKVGTANIAVNARPAAQLDFQNEPGTGAAGAPLAPVRIEVQNDQGGTVTIGTIPVTIELADNPTGAVLRGTRTLNAVNGIASFTDLTVNQAGIGYTLRATSGTLDPAESAPFAIVAGTAAGLSVTTQPSPSSSSGAPLPRQPVLQVRDAAGNAVARAGVQITAALQGAGAALGGTRTVTTNAEGVATYSDLTLSGSAGTYTLLFAAPSLTAVESNGITLGAGTAANLVIVQQPATTAQSGVVLGRQPVIQLQDAQGNPVPQSNLAVTAAIFSGGGSLGGTSTVLTDANGRATFANLSIGGLIGTRTLRFAAASVSAVTSDNVSVLAGPASALVIATGPPPASTSGAVLSPAPMVYIVDAFGNAVDPEVEVTIVATLVGGAAGTLSGTTSVVTAAGSVLFINLILTGPAGSYVLQFGGGALTPVNSSSISIGAGLPASIVLLTQPSASAQSGMVFARQPMVQLRDGSNNVAPVSGVAITVTTQSGDGTLTGTTTQTTNGSGQAVFTDLAITGTPGPRTLRFNGPGLTGVTSSTIDVTSPPAASIEISVQPSTTTTGGQPLAQQPVLLVKDIDGAGVPGTTISATINSGPAGSSLDGASAVTDGSGSATFSALAITGDPGDYTIRFESGALSVVSAVVTISPPATRLLIATPPSANATNAVAMPSQPAIQLADAGGAAVPQAGITVSAVIASGPAGSTLANASAVTSASGVATFSGLAISGLVGTYTLRFESAGLTPITSGNIVLGAGVATTLTVTAQPPLSVENDEPFGSNVVVRVQDASGNNVPGVEVVASIGAGTGTLKGTLTRTTATNGRATFNDLELVGLVGSYTVRFTAPGGANVDTRAITLTPGQEEVLTIQVQPSSEAKSGVNFAVQPKVELRDTGGNLVTESDRRVTAVLETVLGLGSLGGTTQVETDSDGIASWGNLRITGTGTFRIRFTSSGMTSATSDLITVTLL